MLACTVVTASAASAACTQDGAGAPGTESPPVLSTADPMATSTITTSGTTTPADDPLGTGPGLGEPGADQRCDQEAGRSAPRRITVWHSMGRDAQGIFEDMLRQFEDEHKGLAVDASFVGGYTEALQTIRTSGPAELPDLFMSQADSVRLLHDSRLFVTPSTCHSGTLPESLADLWPVVEATYSVDGILQAYPFNVSTPVLLFDKVRFERAGLDADAPPSTMTDLRAAIEQMLDTGAAAQGLVLYDRSASWFIEQWAAREGGELLLPRNGHGTSVIDDVRLDDEASRAGLGWIRALSEDGLATWLGINTSGLDDLFAMVDGDAPAAFTLHTSAAIGDLLRLLGDDSPFPDVRLGVGQLPFPGSGSLVGGGSFWLVDRDDTAAAGAASLLGEWLMAPGQQAVLAAETGYIPATRAAAEVPALLDRWVTSPELAVGFRQLSGAGTTPGAIGMQVGPRVEIQRVLELAGGEAARTDRDLAEILRDAEADIQALLEGYAASG